MITEENSFYPLVHTANVDYGNRQRERLALYHQTIQNARGKAAEQNAREQLSNLWNFTLLGVVAVMTILFAIIALSMHFSGTAPPAV